MSIDAGVDLKQLEMQLYMQKPSLHRLSDTEKQNIRKKLYIQLQLRRPKVELEKYHVHKLLVNIEKNFQKCKDFGIIQTSNEAYEDFQKRNQLMDLKAVQLSEQSDDEDDNIKPIENPERPMPFSPKQTPQSDHDDNLPLAIRKEARKRIHELTTEEYDTSQSYYASSRKRSYKIVSSEPSDYVNINKNDSVDTQVTLTISLPSILRESTDSNLEISVDFGKIDLARQVLDQRIRRISDNEKNSSNSKKNCAEVNNQNSQQSSAEKVLPVDDETLSCLISEVLVESNSVETFRATAALENINNNVGDNYNSNIAGQRRLSVGTETIVSSQPQENGVKKKPRKRTVKTKSTPILPKGPPKKRGRKPLQKLSIDKIDCEKSDLAKYVELFSNNCELPYTATSNTLPSTMSQMVTSTTQNYEDPQQTANETQTAQISYLINGEWTNGGICQLIPSGNVANIGLDTGHISQEDFSLNTPFEDFVNYIDSSNNDVGNNEIARVLDGTNIAPATCSNVLNVANVVSFSQSSLVDNSRKIPYTKNIPPPAHNFEGGILDLSLKSELFSSVTIEEEKEEASTNNCCEPIDLSMKTKNYENQLKGSIQLIQGKEESDDLFLRRLIDSSDFDYKDDNSNQNCDSNERSDLLFEPILNANLSFKAALDMPLLDNDESTLRVDQNSAETLECDKQKKCSKDLDENFGESVAQCEIQDLNTPPRLTFIQIQENTNFFPELEENNQILTQNEVENLILADIVPLQDGDIKNDENKVIDNSDTPPIMSLISKSEDFLNSTQSRYNKEIFKDNTNVENFATPNDDQNTLNTKTYIKDLDTENCIKEEHQQSEDINIVSDEEKKNLDMKNTIADNDADHLIKPHQLQSVETIIDTKSDIDTEQNSVTMETDGTETIITQITNIQDEFKGKILNEEITSKTNNNGTSNDIKSEEKLDNNSDVSKIVESHDDFLGIQTETKVGKGNDQAVNIDLPTRNEFINNEFIQIAVQITKVDCDDVKCISSVQESENIDKDPVQIVEECNLETNNYTLPVAPSKCTNIENKDTQPNVQASVNANTHSEKTFVENVERNIEDEFDKHCLLEAQKENIQSVNISESAETEIDVRNNSKAESSRMNSIECMDVIMNVSKEESSHTIESNIAVEIASKDSRLLEVVSEKMVAKASIEEIANEQNENRTFENSNNVQFAETQLANHNFSPSRIIATEIDVKPSLCNENYKSEFKKPKPAPKLQIISVVSIDSFIHTNESDNEFIRRTLKNHDNILNKQDPNNKNIEIDKNECGNETKESIKEQSEDCVKINESISEENSNIKKEDVKCIDKFNEATRSVLEVAAIVPEEVKSLFYQDVDIKSETIEVIDIDKTLNSKIKNETETFNTSLENTELKKEQKNFFEQSDINLDKLKEETSIIDLSVSAENDEVILTEQIKSLDLTVKAKVLNPHDNAITDLSVQDINSDENTVYCNNEKNKAEITEDHNSESYHDDEPKCSTTAQNKSTPMLVSQDSSLIMSKAESNGSSEDFIENNSTGDEQQKLCVEEHNTKPLINMLETEKNDIITTVSENAQPNNPKNSVFFSNLSLLEMETKFDESLDFDNHFEDDVLSLATSCFNSPDDDRFNSSKVLDETDAADIKPIFVISSDDSSPFKPEFAEVILRPQMKEEINEIEKKEFPIDPISTLKKFKIPKLGAPQMIPFMQQSNESQPTKRIELDKITRTVQNICAVPPLPLQPPAVCSVSNTSMLPHRKHDLFPNTSGNGISCVIALDQKVDCESFAKDILVHSNPNFINMSRGQFAGRGGEAQNSGSAVLDFARIFGPSCLPFLVDKCPVIGNTQHNHQLRPAALVQMALEGLPKTELNTVYKFMFNHSKLFRRYFFVFCNVYSKHKNCSKLLNMVYDCEKQNGCIILLRNVFYSLIECGLNKVNACRQILSRSRDRSSATIDVLVGIIFEADWGMFCDYLEQFSQVPNYSFRINLLNEMAARVLRTKDTRLSSVVCKCLLTLNQDDYKLVNRTPNLIALLKLMKDGKVC